jgi:hypothetical protein
LRERGRRTEGRDAGQSAITTIISISLVIFSITVMILFFTLIAPRADATGTKIELRRDDSAGRLQILIDGREALVYQYAPTLDMPHYWPLNSPGGSNMPVEQTEPYPHHRSFWFADTVRLDGGREVSFYNALYSGRKTGENAYGPPFRDHIRHKGFARLEANGGGKAVVEAELVWEMDGDAPVLKEERRLTVHGLGEGEYFLDLTFKLISAYGEIEFVSDDVHYAWPFLRLEKAWSGENGGVIVSDTGAAGQEATNMKVARWIDYSNADGGDEGGAEAVAGAASGARSGEAAGIAVFQWPDGKDHRWLTREYGCFGPRREDERSGKPFTLKKGESITQRVGVLVHRGDFKTGRVAERYALYVAGKWPQ